MKHVNVQLSEGPLIVTHGEVVLDNADNSLLVYGENGTYVNFTRSHVLYYTVNEEKEHTDDLF